MRVEEWIGLDNKIGLDIWNKKYRYNDETFDEFLNRVSGNDKELRQLIEDKKFLFGGRILANRGTNNGGRKACYSNCFVCEPPEDSIESIFETARDMARIYSRGGGCGVDISKLAPNGAKINNEAKQTSGAVSFMDLYDTTTRLIGQHGRRGALMISMDCSHPDIEEFISCKGDLTKSTKANISVKITDEFMEAVRNDEQWEMKFYRPETDCYQSKKIPARDLFMKIAEMNWRTAEPGVLFWDRIQNYNLMSEHKDFHYSGVNPCGEEPLVENCSCLLGSLNLAAFVEEPFSDDAYFDFDGLCEAVDIATKALNIVLDEGIPYLPLEKQRRAAEKYRPIGLGIFGLHDMLIKMSMAYGSVDAIDLCEEIADIIIQGACVASCEYAERHGACEYIDPQKVLHTQFYQDNLWYDDIREMIEGVGLRNTQLLTIPPTGSISNLLGVSSGIEPIFATEYTRKTESLNGHEQTYQVVAPVIKEYMAFHDIESIDDLPEWISTSHQIHYKDRIAMQSVWQSRIDASISSTINLPHDATVEDVAQIYYEAWESGLKGVTVYRDGCERDGILSTNAQDEDSDVNMASGFDSVSPVTREALGKRLDGAVYTKEVACGKIYIIISYTEDGDLVEVFVDGAKSGGCSTNTEAVGRLASMALRSGIAVDSVVDAIRGLKCAACQNVKGSKIKPIDGLSCPDVIAKTIEEEYRLRHQHCEKKCEHCQCTEGQASYQQEEILNPLDGTTCPECGVPIHHEGGCLVCHNCAWSKCG